MKFLLKLFSTLSYFSVINGQFNPLMITKSIDANSILCAGAKFNETAVVVPASCIAGRVLNKLGVERRVPRDDGYFALRVRAIGGSWHENFASYDPSLNNIGIIQDNSYHSEFDPHFPPRSLSLIPDIPVSCLLTGWIRRTQLIEELLTDVVEVLPPSQCGSENHHIHCSIFPNNNHESCKFMVGTPLNCDNSTIAGIVLNENGCESKLIEINGVQTLVGMLRYTSMSLLHEWQNSKIVVNPIEVTDFSTSNSKVLCAGVKFNANAAIVPASCIAAIDFNRLRIQMRIRTLPGIITEISNTKWHHNFNAENSSVNNIGIIEFNEFNHDILSPFFVPKNLTYIPNRSIMCSLTSWFQTNSGDELSTEMVEVLPPSECDSGNPHIFCSMFTHLNRPICNFVAGSPLSCDNSTIAGIVLSENGCESRTIVVNGVRTQVMMLKYTSMSLFHKWQTKETLVNPIEVTERANTKVLCAGVKFNETAAIAPASCIAGEDLKKLGIQRRIETLPEIVTEISSSAWHQNFNAENPDANNIGVIKFNGLNDDILSPFFNPINLTNIPNRSIMCTLTGWVRMNIHDRIITDMVEVFPPSECGSENPHVFCSKFNNLIQLSCGFTAGTPLICDNETIAGIVLSENGCESRIIEVNGVRTQVIMLRYTSMSLFHEWQNSGKRFLQSSIMVMSLGFFVAFLNFKNSQ